MSPPRAFLCKATVKEALNHNGVRGNVFKTLQTHGAFYSKGEGIKVGYESHNLKIEAYFLDLNNAIAFQNALLNWNMHNILYDLGGVIIDPINPMEVPRPDDLIRIVLMTDYDPKGSESPCSELGQLLSYRLSGPSTEGAEPQTSLVKFQAIDKAYADVLHYKCHLKDRAKFRNLANNENNMVTASWLFHQMMDGLNTLEGIPLVAISVETASEHSSAAHDNRYAVTLQLEFYNETSALTFVPTAQAKKVDNTRWVTCVYVKDVSLFQECVAWKAKDTQAKWLKHGEFLERE
jgi:hypothetical protein